MYSSSSKMAAVFGLAMFLSAFKSKYRRKSIYSNSLIALTYVVFVVAIGESKNDCSNIQCVHGSCHNETCVCEKGWQGTGCEFCGGRLRLTTSSGFITDGPGNYSLNIQCTWLIETGEPNSTLRLRLEHFATECSWDHLYIFDGDSMFSPLLAAYSGLVLQEPHPYARVPEVVATSGSAFLHFISDVAYNMTGFNISYSIDTCTQNCSGQGVCVDGVCTCNSLWSGMACDTPVCPGGCGKGICDPEGCGCRCPDGFRGLDCSQPETTGVWMPIEAYNPPSGRASCQAVVHQDAMSVFGGYSFQVSRFQVLRYHFKAKKWEVTNTSGGIQPRQRYGHSTVLYRNHVYMFGGMLESRIVTDELWLYSLVNRSWSLLPHQCTSPRCSQKPRPPLAVVGHTATLVRDKMVVIFGHSPVYGYMSSVQEYSFSRDEWVLVNTTGAIVRGGYGHTSVYDEYTERIYVHGGFHSVSVSSQTLANVLYSYNPQKKSWYLLTPSKSPRYLHTAAIINGVMIVFGGNTHNDTSHNLGAKCYSTDFLAYDILCDTWHDLIPPSNLYVDIARFGHAAVTYNRSMYIYAGFNGRMLNNILAYTPGSCSNYTSVSSCFEAHSGIKCVWMNSQCHHLPSVSPKTQYDKCPSKSVNYSSLCEALTSCRSCLHSKYDCVWCGNFCSHKNCKENAHPFNKSEECDLGYTSMCARLHNCHACEILGNCSWEAEKCGYIEGLKEPPIVASSSSTEKLNEHTMECPLPCSDHQTCDNCTRGQCIWCDVEKHCVESNAYVASFPYGQCMEWTTQLNKCPARTCSEIKTCEMCHKNPMCGWCDDASGTGLGVCLEGSSKGHMARNSKEVDHSHCPSSQWFFFDCPKCQCNGHSTCLNFSDVCNNCQDLTEGPHCEFCVGGFYGDPTNGGNCTACECNDRSTTCHRETGKCFCTTKGIIGNHCEKCDEQNHYYGEPKDGGTCFYDLTIDFQFTFNLSKPDDRRYTQINFKNTPTKPDITVDFAITCSVPAYINISVKTVAKGERMLLVNYHCTNFKTQFSRSEFAFGSDDDTTFYVFVYDFQPPVWIQIAFSQQPKLDLLQFFATFSSAVTTLFSGK